MMLNVANCLDVKGYIAKRNLTCNCQPNHMQIGDDGYCRPNQDHNNACP